MSAYPSIDSLSDYRSGRMPGSRTVRRPRSPIVPSPGSTGSMYDPADSTGVTAPAAPKLRWQDQPQQVQNRQRANAALRYQNQGMSASDAQARAISDVAPPAPILMEKGSTGSSSTGRAPAVPKEIDPNTQLHTKSLTYRNLLGDANPLHPRPGLPEADARRLAGLDPNSLEHDALPPFVRAPAGGNPPMAPGQPPAGDSFGTNGMATTPPAVPVQRPKEVALHRIGDAFNPITDQQTRAMYGAVNDHLPGAENSGARSAEFNTTTARWGVDGAAWADHHAGPNGQLQTQFIRGEKTLYPAEHIPYSMLGTSGRNEIKGLAAAERGQSLDLPEVKTNVYGPQAGYTPVAPGLLLGPTPPQQAFEPMRDETPADIARHQAQFNAEQQQTQRLYGIRDQYLGGIQPETHPAATTQPSTVAATPPVAPGMAAWPAFTPGHAFHNGKWETMERRYVTGPDGQKQEISAAATDDPNATVAVISPDGTRGRIAASKLADAIQRGFRYVN